MAFVALFRLTISPAGRPGKPLRLKFGDNEGMPVFGAALSPDGEMLALTLVHEFPGPPYYGMWMSSTWPVARFTGFRTRDATASGSSLAASLTAFPASVRGLQSAMIDWGGQFIASSCHAANRTATVRLLELSAVNGRLVRVLRTQTDRFGNATDASDAVSSMCQVQSVAGSGDHVLVQGFTFGRIDNGVFTALPGATSGVLPISAAW